VTFHHGEIELMVEDLRGESPRTDACYVAAALTQLLAEIAAMRPIVEAVHGAAVDQTIGSVKVHNVGSGVTAQYLPTAAAEALAKLEALR
jgi:hypothetical protein